MRPFEHIDSFDIRDYRRDRRPDILLATRFFGGSASSQANPATFTTSGSASPIVSGSGSSATGSSIAVGAGGKYIESGALDLSGAGVSTGNNSTINIGSPATDQAITSLLSSLADGASIPVSVSGTPAPAPSSTASWLDNINWTLVALAAAAVAAVFIIFGAKR